MLPNFLCIGTYRAGTTWLQNVLKEHSDIYLPDEKEIMFFSHHYAKGIGWYERFFNHYQGQKYVGEICPTYLLSSEKTAQRIYKHVPHVKLIVSFRNPPDQVFSLYNLMLTRGRNVSKDLMLVLQEEKWMLDNVLYHKHLSRFLQYFEVGDFLILFFEDLKKDPKEFLSQIYNFLDIDPWYPETIYEIRNKYRKPKSIMLEKCIARTSDFLRRHGLLQLQCALRKTGVSDLLKRLNTVDDHGNKIPSDVAAFINEYVSEDKVRLEMFVKRDLSFWR